MAFPQSHFKGGTLEDPKRYNSTGDAAELAIARDHG